MEKQSLKIKKIKNNSFSKKISKHSKVMKTEVPTHKNVCNSWIILMLEATLTSSFSLYLDM